MYQKSILGIKLHSRSLTKRLALKTPEDLINSNHAWAQALNEKKPGFFKKLSKQQNPDYLWIGCSDSRVPANQIIDIEPGEVFVHRNIANVVVHTDLNCLSVIQYAVDVLNVKHIIVCGHYGCGGVKAALANNRHGLIDNWLRHIKDVIRVNADQLNELNEEDMCNRLCELNVIEQVINVCNTTIVEQAWKDGKQLSVNGWIYSIENGLLNDLKMSITSKDELRQKTKHIFRPDS